MNHTFLGLMLGITEDTTTVTGQQTSVFKLVIDKNFMAV